MIRIFPIVALALVAAGGCSKSGATPADSTLSSDLPLTTQQRDYALDSAERSGERRAGGEVAHSSGTVATQSSGVVVEKHTERDAVIGAAAGGLLGATTSRSKVKGGVIGAAVGGLLGGVIGNNVDKTKKKP